MLKALLDKPTYRFGPVRLPQGIVAPTIYTVERILAQADGHGLGINRRSAPASFFDVIN